jgi:hypothetical protein
LYERSWRDVFENELFVLGGQHRPDAHLAKDGSGFARRKVFGRIVAAAAISLEPLFSFPVRCGRRSGRFLFRLILCRTGCAAYTGANTREGEDQENPWRRTFHYATSGSLGNGSKFRCEEPECAFAKSASSHPISRVAARSKSFVTAGSKPSHLYARQGKAVTAVELTPRPIARRKHSSRGIACRPNQRAKRFRPTAGCSSSLRPAWGDLYAVPNLPLHRGSRSGISTRSPASKNGFKHFA